MSDGEMCPKLKEAVIKTLDKLNGMTDLEFKLTFDLQEITDRYKELLEIAKEMSEALRMVVVLSDRQHEAKFILDSIQKAIEESGVLEYIHHLRKPVMVDIHVGDPKELL